MVNRERTGKGFFIPWPIVRNFLTQLGPLMFIIAQHPGFIFENMPVYKLRLHKNRKPWAYIKDESAYDSRILLNEEDYRNLPGVKNEPYLRPTRLCECDALEIRAMAKKLGAGRLSEEEFANAAYNWVMEEKKLIFKPIGGALQTFRTKGGTCLDQLSLLVAIARAGGIKARYRLYGLAPTQQLYDILVEPNAIIKETYNTLGFLEAMHGEAELFINNKWVAADPTFSPALYAGMDLPITYLGEEPAWRVRVEGKGDIRFESFPAFYKNLMIPVFIILQKIIDQVNESMEEIREKGIKLLNEIGIEEYNNKKKKSFKPVVPSISEVKEFRKKLEEEKILQRFPHSEEN